MTRDEAIAKLSALSVHERLQAARHFARFAVPRDEEPLRDALAREDVYWIRAALERALSTARMRRTMRQGVDAMEPRASSLASEEWRDFYALAVEETTGRLVHELASVIGIADLCAAQEIDDYANSRTKRELERLDALLRAIETLGRAATAPRWREYDLATQIGSISTRESELGAGNIRLAGPTPLLVMADEGLIELIVCNGLRNALEAHLTSKIDLPVVVAWGKTDRDYWITILDRGPGLTSAQERAFEIGTSTKREHLGMGLALARQAVESLHGEVRLVNRPDGGAAYEVHWPVITLEG